MQGILVRAQTLKQLRLARGYTQRELAALAGVSERTVRNAEAGRRIRLDFLSYVAVALGVDRVDLIDARDELCAALQHERRVAIILQAIETHVASGDQGELRSLVAPGVVFHSPGPDDIPFAGEYRGFDGLRRFFDIASQSIAYDAPPQITNVRSGGNLVVINGVDRIRAIPTGRSTVTPWMHVYEFDGGRVVRVDNWGDTATVVQAFRGA